MKNPSLGKRRKGTGKIRLHENTSVCVCLSLSVSTTLLNCLVSCHFHAFSLLGPRNVVSGTRDNTPPETTLASVYM